MKWLIKPSSEQWTLNIHIWCQTDQGDLIWESGESSQTSLSVFYLNVAIHHQVTTALTSHLGRLIMDPPLWIWLISSLFQIYYTVGPKVEMQWMVRMRSASKYRAWCIHDYSGFQGKINTVNINRFDNKSPYLFKVKDNNYNFRQRD